MPKRYLGNIITPNPQKPANNFQDTSAPGVWGIYEVSDLIEQGLWPTLGNINPAKFVENIFSTFLYEGTGSTRTITNGLNLSGEGGMVWIKNRSLAYAPMIFDTARGLPSLLYTSANLGADTTSGLATGTVTGFNADGFDLGTEAAANRNGDDLVSWTFRNAPKFFTCITYSGTGTAQNISHDLGSVPGCIMVKRTDDTDNWTVYHRGVDASAPEDYYMELNATDGKKSNAARWNNTAPTSTQFTVGTAGTVNASGGSYVAYLFAHNDGDGDFGPTGDQDIIKCGSYTGNGSDPGPEIDLGFQPQWVIIKRADAAASWFVIDTARGWTNSSDTFPLDDPYLLANSLQIEYANPYTKPLATGFQPATTAASFNSNGGTYTYIAIRRGPMAVPTVGTDVYKTILRTGTSSTASVTGVGFSPDLIITGARNANRTHGVFTRLLGATRYQISTGETGEYSNTTTLTSFDMDGYSVGSDSGATAINTSDSLVSWNFKRATNVYDTVIYNGTGSATTVSHNLGIAPELIMIKGASTSFDRRWIVYTGTANKYMRLNQTDSDITDGTVFNNTSPGATSFTVGTSSNTNASGENYVAHLFGTLSGISKVGSYTGNGSSQNIDCEFTSGARFILIKRSDSAGDWYVWDSSRGITTGNDPHLSLNSTNSEVSTDDSVDPVSSGFAVNQVAATNINVSSASYIFLAIS